MGIYTFKQLIIYFVLAIIFSIISFSLSALYDFICDNGDIISTILSIIVKIAFFISGIITINYFIPILVSLLFLIAFPIHLLMQTIYSFVLSFFV